MSMLSSWASAVSDGGFGQDGWDGILVSESRGEIYSFSLYVRERGLTLFLPLNPLASPPPLALSLWLWRSRRFFLTHPPLPLPSLDQARKKSYSDPFFPPSNATFSTPRVFDTR